jgi:hypothetical protein
MFEAYQVPLAACAYTGPCLVTWRQNSQSARRRPGRKSKIVIRVLSRQPAPVHLNWPRANQRPIGFEVENDRPAGVLDFDQRLIAGILDRVVLSIGGVSAGEHRRSGIELDGKTAWAGVLASYAQAWREYFGRRFGGAQRPQEVSRIWGNRTRGCHNANRATLGLRLIGWGVPPIAITELVIIGIRRLRYMP